MQQVFVAVAAQVCPLVFPCVLCVKTQKQMDRNGNSEISLTLGLFVYLLLLLSSLKSISRIYFHSRLLICSLF